MLQEASEEEFDLNGHNISKLSDDNSGNQGYPDERTPISNGRWPNVCGLNL
jgi:hypothetical protein